MATPHDTVSISVIRRFDAPAERLYDAFLDPAQASRFLFATALGRIVRCEIDPRAEALSPSSIGATITTSLTTAPFSSSNGRTGWCSRSASARIPARRTG